MKYVELPGGVTIRDDSEDRVAAKALVNAVSPAERAAVLLSLTRIIRRNVAQHMDHVLPHRR